MTGPVFPVVHPVAQTLSTILRQLPLAQATQQFSSACNASNIAAGQAVPGRARYRLALADGLLEVVVGEEFPVVELDIKVRESRFAVVRIGGREEVLRDVTDATQAQVVTSSCFDASNAPVQMRLV